MGIEPSLLSAAAETSSLIIPLRLATFERSRDSKIGLWIDPFLSIQPRAIRLLKSLSSSSSLLPFSFFGFSSSERLDVTPFLPIELSETTTHPEWSPPPPVESSLSAFAVQYTAREIFGVEPQRQIRGDRDLDNYEVNNSVTSRSRSSYPTSYESYVCPLSSGIW